MVQITDERQHNEQDMPERRSMLGRLSLIHLHAVSNRRSKHTNENTSLAACLPADILVYIFEVLRGPLSFWCHSNRPNSSWFLVSHVCRWWRQVALGNPGLWSMIFSKSSHSWKYFIDRSQDAPLRLTLSISDKRRAKAARLIPAHLHQVTHLCLHGLQLFDALPYLSIQMPLLKALHLNAHKCKKRRWNSTTARNGTIPPLFHAPHLCELSLVLIPISAAMALFSSSLVVLKLFGNNWDNLVPLATMIDILHRLPLLKKLELRHIIADPINSDLLDETLSATTTVHLSDLWNLRVSTLHPFIHKALMTHLDMPALGRLCMHTTVQSRDEASHPFLPSLLWTDAPLTVDIAGDAQSIHIRCMSIHPSIENMEEPDVFMDDPYMVLLIGLTDDAIAEMPRMLYDICTHVPLRIVRSLHLWFAGERVDWTPILAEMNALEEMGIEYDRWKEVLQVLTPNVIRDDGILLVLCPRLRKLEITLYNSVPKARKLFFEALAITISVRRAEGSELEEVVYDGTTIPCREAEDIATLRRWSSPPP
ncbi:hypothetical protein DENSPDRAFT_39371 [Dentipellis sp. KUC8613]|nr:hypothetical protein DENSPDRAFT_39371 [Dentipellis sp. KUC8613]